MQISENTIKQNTVYDQHSSSGCFWNSVQCAPSLFHFSLLCPWGLRSSGYFSSSSSFILHLLWSLFAGIALNIVSPIFSLHMSSLNIRTHFHSFSSHLLTCYHLFYSFLGSKPHSVPHSVMLWRASAHCIQQALWSVSFLLVPVKKGIPGRWKWRWLKTPVPASRSWQWCPVAASGLFHAPVSFEFPSSLMGNPQRNQKHPGSILLRAGGLGGSYMPVACHGYPHTCLAISSPQKSEHWQQVALTSLVWASATRHSFLKSLRLIHGGCTQLWGLSTNCTVSHTLRSSLWLHIANPRMSSISPMTALLSFCSSRLGGGNFVLWLFISMPIQPPGTFVSNSLH